jgi:methylglutaconyl-CoA hydratase
VSGWTYETVNVAVQRAVAHVRLNRPEIRNAFNEQMIADLTDLFGRLGREPGLRAVVLGGEGSVFCAGADVDWMRRSIDRTEQDNVADAQAMATMYRTIDECPLPVIGRVQKAAFGGAIGLVAVCDIVVAEKTAKFCFSEVRLGIVPAVISTFSIAKIGVALARRYFLTAEVFTAEHAPPGLVHEIVDVGELDSRIEQLLDALRQCGPEAVREIKQLIPRTVALDRTAAVDLCAATIARVRVGAEAQAGLRAFLDKRPAPWVPGTRKDD